MMDRLKTRRVAGQTFPGTGTVTSVAAGTGLTGGPITSSGALSIDTTVVPQLGAATNTFSGSIVAAKKMMPGLTCGVILVRG
jgi:hypothetical protein